MKIASLLTTERKALAALALFLAAIFLVPWSRIFFDSDEREVAEEASESLSVENDYGSQGVPSAHTYKEPHNRAWRAKSSYTPRTGNIVVDLSHRDIPVDGELKVFANFSPTVARRPASGRWLTRQPDGTYRSTGVRLGSGTWTMGLTGYRHSQFAFRLEQKFEVK